MLAFGALALGKPLHLVAVLPADLMPSCLLYGEPRQNLHWVKMGATFAALDCGKVTIDYKGLRSQKVVALLAALDLKRLAGFPAFFERDWYLCDIVVAHALTFP